MKVLKILLLLLLVAIGLVVVIGFTVPASIEFSVERNIKAPPEAIYAALVDLKAYRQWEPFGTNDPSFRVEFEEQTEGVGAAFNFRSDRSATGRLAIVAAEPPRSVTYHVVFAGDEANVVETTLTLEPRGPETTHLRWDFTGSRSGNPLARILMRVWKPTVVRIHQEGLDALDAYLHDRLEVSRAD